ncbi:MAG: acyl-CoA dehydrogenase [Gammaproteobacteria bacterium]|nr:acyl-CoA dehydrogenase [Gammaproteobacteria bacterium]
MARLWILPTLFLAAILSAATGSWLTALVFIISCLAILLATDVRKSLLIKPLFSAFSRAMPTLSATEREALESGTVWWDGQLFSGKPDWELLLSSARHNLTAEEQAFLDGPTERLCEQLNDWQITHKKRDLPEHIWAFIKQQRFFGLIIPKKYGGLGFSPLAHSQMVMKVASRSLTTAVTVMVPNSLGPAELLLHYGTEQQKDYYLPRLASGEEIPCFALTGPEAGSDASNLPDKGIVCRQLFEGKEITGIVINWEKRYITLGPVATLLGLAFHLYDPDHLLGDKEDIGITLALIPTDTKGINIGRRHWPMGMAFQNGPNWGKDVFIPMDWVIGGEQRIGQGWRMLMESLAAGRSISLPALSAGAAKLAVQTSSAYARIRQQFHLPIGRFEGIADVLGRMVGLTYMIDAVRITTAQAVTDGERPAVLSAIAKYHLTETMRHIINDAMDIHGGKGICLGPRNVLAHAYQAIPISITVEGANILTRNLIIFGQGSIRAHPYILQEMATLEITDPSQAIAQFDSLLTDHIKHTVATASRSLILGFSKGRLSTAPDSSLRRYYQQLNHLSAALAVATDISLALLGGSLKRRESLSARLGDVLSQLYLASSTLRQYEFNDQQDDLILAQWACEHAIYQAQQALLDLMDNLPNRLVSWLLKQFIFPLGPRYKKPDDKLTHALAELVLQPNPGRDRLTSGIYKPDDTQHVLGQLEQAFTLCVAAEPIEKKLKKSAYDSVEHALENKVITNDEYQLVTHARTARRQIIDVDHFTSQLEEDAS